MQSILKDSRGFIWFGTQDGLNRYDGSGIKIYRHDPKDPNSLPSSVIVLFEDSKKRLWIGSGWAGRGVALYDRAHDRFRTFLPSSELADRNHVRTIIEDRQGQIWLGTSGAVTRIDAETGVIQLFPLTPDGSAAATGSVVLSLHEDRRGRLWAGTDSSSSTARAVATSAGQRHGCIGSYPMTVGGSTSGRRAADSTSSTCARASSRTRFLIRKTRRA